MSSSHHPKSSHRSHSSTHKHHHSSKHTSNRDPYQCPSDEFAQLSLHKQYQPTDHIINTYQPDRDYHRDYIFLEDDIAPHHPKNYPPDQPHRDHRKHRDHTKHKDQTKQADQVRHKDQTKQTDQVRHRDHDIHNHVINQDRHTEKTEGREVRGREERAMRGREEREMRGREERAVRGREERERREVREREGREEREVREGRKMRGREVRPGKEGRREEKYEEVQKDEGETTVELVAEVVIIKKKSDYDQLKKKYEKFVMFYGASWCTACHEMFPLYNKLAKQYGKEMGFGYCDVEKARLDFSKVPVFVSVYQGEELDNCLGANKEGLQELINNCRKK
jgi:thiol-disulfide isomerase/thioredoxin